MPGCNVCGFNPEDYGYRADERVPLGRGGSVSLLACDRCGCNVCSSHCETGPVSGYGADEWYGAILCNDCVRAVNEEAAAEWEEEFGDSGLENPYLTKEEL